MDSRSYKEKVFFVLCITLALTLSVAAFGYRMFDQVETIKTEWQGFEHESSQRARLLNQIQADLGYGGFIHLFKNYVLRKDPTLIPKIEAKLASLHASVEKYDNYAKSDREHIALAKLRQILVSYESKYMLARELIINGIDTDSLDAIVAVDESPALEAIQTLSDTVIAHAKNHQRITTQRFSEAQTLVRWGSLLLPIMLVSSGILIYLLRRILKAEKRVQHLAHFDMLTALPNRILFHDRLQQAILRVQRNHTISALLFIDLDGFKQVNDNFGHETGDKLLKLLAQRLQGAIRKSDTVARLGGDEFVVIVETIASDRHSEMIARKLLDAVKSPITINGDVLSISASIGISICPDDALDDAQLMHNADLAMYQAKKAGKHCFRRFDITTTPTVMKQQSVLDN